MAAVRTSRTPIKMTQTMRRLASGGREFMLANQAAEVKHGTSAAALDRALQGVSDARETRSCSSVGAEEGEAPDGVASSWRRWRWRTAARCRWGSGPASPGK